MKIMVLSDGETFSDVAGCRIYDVKNEKVDNSDIEAFLMGGGADSEEIVLIGEFNADGWFMEKQQEGG